VNISFMSVAPAGFEAGEGFQVGSGFSTPPGEVGVGEEGKREALMILGVDGEVKGEVVKELIGAGGVLSVSVVNL